MIVPARAAVAQFSLLGHRDRHLRPRRRCRCCGWGCGGGYRCAAVVVLRLLLVFPAFVSRTKKLAVVWCGGDHDCGDRARPSCCAAIYIAGPATATSAPTVAVPAAAAAAAAAAAVLLLLCFCCCCAAVLTHSLVRVFQ